MTVMQREIQTIDAQGKSPGRLASEIARFLIGKHKPTYTPHIDDGDHVQVINASKMTVTAKKLDQKVYTHHTEYAHGLRQESMAKVWSIDPSEVLRRAVSRMLPKNKHRNERLKRLLVTN